MVQLDDEVAALAEKKSAPFGGKWKQPKVGPWISVAINGEREDKSEFGGTFPMRAANRTKIIRQGHKPWIRWATKRWGAEPYRVTVFWHHGRASGRDVLWRWDRWEGFRDTALLRGMQRQIANEALDEMNGDAVQHIVDMARRHGIKGEGPDGKLTPAQARKLAAMREDLSDEVDALVETG